MNLKKNEILVDSSKRSQMGKSIDITIIRDIPYATQSNAQKLDIYLLAKKG